MHIIPIMIQKNFENDMNIDMKGRLTEQQMRELYNKFIGSPRYSKVEPRNIHRSFNDAHIISLKNVWILNLSVDSPKTVYRKTLVDYYYG